MGQGVRSTTTTQQWAETITAKVQTIAGQLGVKRFKLMDVNSATLEQLQSLRGIGVHYAKRIAEGRPYRRTDELVTKNVLTKDTHDRMKNQIVVKQPCATYRQPLRLTITVEKIDHVLDDVRAQIEGLQHDLVKLRLARARIALLPVNEQAQERPQSRASDGDYGYGSPSM